MKDTIAFSKITKKLRKFFDDKGFLEVPAQSRLSILAACEDPENMRVFNFDDSIYPLPQTGQMWLEHELLKERDAEGFYCVTTSYRDEPNPISGRHDKIFPMFEFEAKGDVLDLKDLLSDLLECFELPKPKHLEYEEVCQDFNVFEIGAEEETKICEKYGPSVFLEKFPSRSNPFWNMKKEASHSDLFNKVDVILHGFETIGSAERATNKEEMEKQFQTISNGKYAEILYDAFTSERVKKELTEYLNFEMFERFGGGIGITRLARALELENLL